MSSRAPSRLALLVVLLLRAVPAVAVPAHVTLEFASTPARVSRGERLPVTIVAHIDRGWHIQAHVPSQPYLIPTELTVQVSPGEAVIDPVVYPAPERRTLAFAGNADLLVYEDTVDLRTILTIPAETTDGRLQVEAHLRYQACSNTTCLPPTTARVAWTAAIGGAVLEPAAPRGTAPPTTPADERFAVGRWIQDYGLILTLLAVAVLGVGLNLTPCVYPLISVTVAYFGNQSRHRGRVLELAAIYVLGIALSFSALGAAAGLSGGFFGAVLQRPAFIFALAALLVFLALGSFGLYEFHVPSALLRRAGGTGRGVAGALFMGLTMGVVAAPCVGPIVSGLLVFVGLRQDPLLGFLLFFALAIGMGAPYVVLAVAAGSLKHLPRSGEWLVWTERLFGCILLVMAVYFAAPLLPGPSRRYLLPAALGLSGLYLGFIEQAGRALRHFPLFKRVVGVLLIAFALRLGQTAATRGTIEWEPLSAAAHAQRIVHSGAPVLIDFAADWCIPCRQMDDDTFAHPAVLREAKRFRMVKADITQETDQTTALEEYFAVRGVPTVILFSSAGTEQRRFVGYVSAVDLLAAMRDVP